MQETAIEDPAKIIDDDVLHVRFFAGVIALDEGEQLVPHDVRVDQLQDNVHKDPLGGPGFAAIESGSLGENVLGNGQMIPWIPQEAAVGLHPVFLRHGCPVLFVSAEVIVDGGIILQDFLLVIEAAAAPEQEDQVAQNLQIQVLKGWDGFRGPVHKGEELLAEGLVVQQRVEEQNGWLIGHHLVQLDTGAETGLQIEIDEFSSGIVQELNGHALELVIGIHGGIRHKGHEG